LTVVVAASALVLTALPLLVLFTQKERGALGHDWQKAKGKVQGGNAKRFRAFLFYLFFFLLFWLFFGRTMFELPDGIYTGGSQNFGDLPFHLGAIFSFTDGANFPPQNPSWAGGRFTYPFIADLLTAVWMRLGADVKNAMFVQNVGWAFSLLVILEAFVARVTGSKLAGRLAPFLLCFSGGLGFLWFLVDWWAGSASISHLARDYTIGTDFRWGNPLVVLFMTQRSLLLGMPLTILVLGWLWSIFNAEGAQNADRQKEKSALSTLRPLAVGLLAGTLVLIHLHSLVVLFIVTGFLFLMRPVQWKEWLVFGAGVAIVALPELIWSLTGSATETTKFFEFFFGWDKGETNFLWFWVKNTGLVIPMILAAVYVFLTQRRKDANGETEKGSTTTLILFYVPFVFLFVLSNIAKLAPWEWDNIKILIYWYVGSLPFIALLLAWLWERRKAWAVVSAVCFVALIFSGSLDVWRTVSGQVKFKVFDADAVKIAEMIKQKTPAYALFLNAPTFNSAVVLSGRQSLMRYSGHLMSHGIDYLPREDDVKRIYTGGGVADILLRKYNVDYVLVSPIERNDLKANEDIWRKYPIVAESGQYRVYKVK